MPSRPRPIYTCLQLVQVEQLAVNRIYLKWEAPSRTTATEGVEVEIVFAMQFALAVLVAILIASYWRVLLRILLVVGLASLLVGIVDIVSALGNN